MVVHLTFNHLMIWTFFYTGIFSNDTIEKIAKGIPENWETFAKKLGCSNDDITRIKSTHVFKVKQALQMLDWWRLTDSAIQKGTDLVKSFHETAKSAQLGARLLTLVSSHLWTFDMVTFMLTPYQQSANWFT